MVIKLFLLAWLATSLFAMIAWLHYFIYRINCIIDVIWPLGIWLSGLVITWNTVPAIPFIWLHSTLGIWSLRLALYLFITRVAPQKQDPRYQNISSNWKKSKLYGYFWNYQMQAVLMMSLSAPFFLAHLIEISPWSLACFGFMLLALCGESWSDYLLYRHQQNTTTSLCLLGPWKYSRHPNYFFDWLFWFALACLVLPFNHGWLGLTSPLALYLIMNKITIPISEKNSLQKRPKDYALYQKTTSVFFPTFQQKRHSS
ncbi:MAG TPA: DUF1295 domain-containing protein [Gammaproteobacteria bacterium]|nr:DUF1295 domain-containing protein [Gammaproteobacteria bacterium]